MVVYAHGGRTNGLKFLVDTHEILASHGFVVVLIDHTANVGRSSFSQDPDLSFTLCPHCSTPDIPFAIDVMLDRNEDPNDILYGSIDPDAIGLHGWSRGFGSTLAATVGIDAYGLVASGIIPDLRVKAIFPSDARSRNLPDESLRAVSIPVFAYAGRHSERREKATSLLLYAETPRAHKMGSWIDGGHVAVGGDICVRVARVLDAVEAGTATSWDRFEIGPGLIEGVPEHCPASVFEGHTPQDIASLGFDPSSIEDMPTGIPNAELVRLKTFYLVAFFERYLAHKGYYAKFLTQHYADENEPLIHFGVGDFPGAPEEVLVCHEGEDTLIEPAAFHAHLDHGDTRGGCGE